MRCRYRRRMCGATGVLLGMTLLAPLAGQEQRSAPEAVSREEAQRRAGECSLAWRTALSGEVRAFAVAEDGETLYAAADDRRLYAIDRDGTVLWKRALQRVPGGELQTVPEGMLTLTAGGSGSEDGAGEEGRVFLLNRRGGAVWDMPLPDGYRGLAVAPNGTLYIAGEKVLKAVSHTGRLRWQRDLPARPSGAPVFSRRYGLLVPCEDAFVRAYTPGGILRWEFRAAGTPGRPIPRSEGIYSATAAGTVVLVSAEGTLVRQFRDTSKRVFTAAAAGDSGIVTAAGKELLELSPGGERQRAAQLPFTPLAGTEREGRIALFGKEGAAAVMHAEANGDIREVWTLRMPPASVMPVLFGEELLAAGGKDWVVYAYRCAASGGGADGKNGVPGEVSRDAAQEKWKRGEKLVRKYSVGSEAAEVLRETILGSGNRELLAELLDTAERVLESRTPEREEIGYLRAVEKVLLEGVRNPKFREGRIINDFPELRQRAAQLLGVHGDLASRERLIELLKHEWAEAVISEAVQALSKLGGTGDGRGAALLLRKMRGEAGRRDDSLANAAIDYVRREYHFHGELRPSSLELLQSIYQGGYSRSMRLRAMKTLRGLKGDA